MENKDVSNGSQLFGRSPIYTVGGKWYFWDETWSVSHGPYSDKNEAESELDRYCQFLNQLGDNTKE